MFMPVSTSMESHGVPAAQEGQEGQEGPTVLVVTYNVNRYLISDSLASIALAAASVLGNRPPPDLIAVTLQEAAPEHLENSTPQQRPTPTTASSSLFCTTFANDDDDDDDHDNNGDTASSTAPIAAYHSRPRSSSSSGGGGGGTLTADPRAFPDLSALPTPAVRGLLTDPITAHWWLDKIVSDLGCSFTRRAYCPVTSPPLVLGGTLLAVLVAADVRHCVADVREAFRAVGPFGFPNKGAVAVSLLWGDQVRIALVGAHLPHGKRPGPRDRALDQIVQGLVFEPNVTAAATETHTHHQGQSFFTGNTTATARVAPATPSPPRLRSRIRSQESLSTPSSPALLSDTTDMDDAAEAPLLAPASEEPRTPPSPALPPAQVSSPLTLGDHHLTILAGDLNYRTSLPAFSAAAPLLATRNWHALRAHDQLAASSQVRAHGWQEVASLGFGPTYRTIPVGRPLPGLQLPSGCASLLGDGAAAVGQGGGKSWVGVSGAASEGDTVAVGLGGWPSAPATAPSTSTGTAASTTGVRVQPPWWPVSYDPLRVPGWTDRVLVRPTSPAHTLVECLQYAAFPLLRQSDHVPVSALVRVRHGRPAAPTPSFSASRAAVPDNGQWRQRQREQQQCLWAHRAAKEWTLWLVFVLTSRTRTWVVVGGLVVSAWVTVMVVVWAVRLVCE